MKTAHEDAEKYKCSDCPKLYSRMDSAKRHIIKCVHGGTLVVVGMRDDIVCPVTVILDTSLYTVPMTVSASALVRPAYSMATATTSRVAATSVNVVQPVVSVVEVPSTSGGSSVASGGSAAVPTVADAVAGKVDIQKLILSLSYVGLFCLF